MRQLFSKENMTLSNIEPPSQRAYSPLRDMETFLASVGATEEERAFLKEVLGAEKWRQLHGQHWNIGLCQAQGIRHYLDTRRAAHAALEEAALIFRRSSEAPDTAEQTRVSILSLLARVGAAAA